MYYLITVLTQVYKIHFDLEIAFIGVEIHKTFNKLNKNVFYNLN